MKGDSFAQIRLWTRNSSSFPFEWKYYFIFICLRRIPSCNLQHRMPNSFVEVHRTHLLSAELVCFLCCRGEVVTCKEVLVKIKVCMSEITKLWESSLSTHARAWKHTHTCRDPRTHMRAHAHYPGYSALNEFISAMITTCWLAII